MKKIISLLLVLVMVFSMTAFASAASMPNDVYHSKNREAIETLYHYGILEGHGNGKYMPKDTLTRAEACAMITRAMLVDENIEPSYRSYFSDVTRAWYRKYVDTAVRHDYMHGYGDGTFGPEDEVTYAQFATIVLNMLGYNAPELDGTWPENTEEIADVLKIYYNTTDHELNDAITREDAAQMIYNALDNQMVKWYKGELIFIGKTLADVINKIEPEFVDSRVFYTKTDTVNSCEFNFYGKYFVMTFKGHEEEFYVNAKAINRNIINAGDMMTFVCYFDQMTNKWIITEIIAINHIENTKPEYDYENMEVQRILPNGSTSRVYFTDGSCFIINNTRDEVIANFNVEDVISFNVENDVITDYKVVQVAYYTFETWTRYHLRDCKYVIEAEVDVVKYNPEIHTEQTPCKICFPVE